MNIKSLYLDILEQFYKDKNLPINFNLNDLDIIIDKSQLSNIFESSYLVSLKIGENSAVYNRTLLKTFKEVSSICLENFNKTDELLITVLERMYNSNDTTVCVFLENPAQNNYQYMAYIRYIPKTFFRTDYVILKYYEIESTQRPTFIVTSGWTEIKKFKFKSLKEAILSIKHSVYDYMFI